MNKWLFPALMSTGLKNTNGLEGVDSIQNTNSKPSLLFQYSKVDKLLNSQNKNFTKNFCTLATSPIHNNKNDLNKIRLEFENINQYKLMKEAAPDIHDDMFVKCYLLIRYMISEHTTEDEARTHLIESPLKDSVSKFFKINRGGDKFGKLVITNDDIKNNAKGLVQLYDKTITKFERLNLESCSDEDKEVVWNTIEHLKSHLNITSQYYQDNFDASLYGRIDKLITQLGETVEKGSKSVGTWVWEEFGPTIKTGTLLSLLYFTCLLFSLLIFVSKSIRVLIDGLPQVYKKSSKLFLCSGNDVGDSNDGNDDKKVESIVDHNKLESLVNSKELTVDKIKTLLSNNNIEHLKNRPKKDKYIAYLTNKVKDGLIHINDIEIILQIKKR